MAEEVVIKITAQDSFSGVLGNFGNIITGIRSAISLAGDAFRAFTGFALDGLEAIGNYERLTATMETLVAKELMAAGAAETMADALSMSGDRAQDLLHWVQQLAIESPFSQEGVANAFRVALAYGFTADEAQRLTEAMINFAAGSGATEGAMSQIALALGQIQAKGKLAGQEVLQLVNAGLPVNQILAEAFNVTTEEIVEMREKGLIPAHQAIEAITSYLETNFAGAAQRQADTWTGLKNTFEDIKEIGLREFFGGLADVLKPIAVDLSNFLQDPATQEGIKVFGELLGGLVGTIFEDFQGFADSPLMLWLQDLLDRSTVVIETLKEGRDTLWDLKNTDERFVLDSVIDVDLFKENLKSDLQAAFQEALDSLNEVDWGKFSESIINWINNTGTGSAFIDAANAIVKALARALEETDWEGIGWAIDAKLADVIREIDWFQTGSAFGESFKGLGSNFWQKLEDNFTTESGDFNWGKILAPAFFYPLDTEFGKAAKDAVTAFFFGFSSNFKEWEGTVKIWFKVFGDDLKKSIIEGWLGGWAGIFEWAFTTPFSEAIKKIKELFGISSPSKVFFEIGQNIVLGFIQGIQSLIGTAIAALLGPFEPILNLLGIDLGGLTAPSVSTITLGTGTTTTGGLVGQPVTNNYYGPVYFMGAGEPGAYYDCPSPNPFLAATGGQLVTNP